MTRYLVAGGSGFIGSALVRRLVQADETVLNIDLLTYAALPGSLDSIDKMPNYSFLQASIADAESMEAAFTRFQPDIVVNLAAESHVDRSIDDAWPFIATNVVGVGTLLASATDYWISKQRSEDFRFIQVSTDEVFGSTVQGRFTPSSPYRPTSPYAASKAAGDLLARSWFHTHGLPVIITNSSNNYGPYQHPEKLIPMLIIRSAEGLTLPIYGDGLQERDWIHVDDHVRGLLAACGSGDPGEAYLFGTGEARTNFSVAQRISQLVDSRFGRPAHTSEQLIEFVEDRPGHDSRYCVDPTETTRKLGWSAVEGFEATLARTVTWYCDNSDWWRPLIGSDAISRKGLAR